MTKLMQIIGKGKVMKKKTKKRFIWSIAVAVIACLALMLVCNQIVVNNTKGKELAQIDVDNDSLQNDWQWHIDGAFKYPKSFSHEETFVEEVPGSVEVYLDGDVQLCYWPLLGMWSTFAEFPEEGVWLSPTERVKEVTYRAESKGIASGYTQSGNIFYMKQKIMSGGEVNHSKVLVLITPPSMKDNVESLTNEVANW